MGSHFNHFLVNDLLLHCCVHWVYIGRVQSKRNETKNKINENDPLDRVDERKKLNKFLIQQRKR